MPGPLVKHLLQYPVPAAMLFVLGLGLTACDACEDVYCAPCSPFTDNIRVLFDLDSLRGGFRKADFQQAYAVLYEAPGFDRPIDTLREGTVGNGHRFSFYTNSGTLLFQPGRIIVGSYFFGNGNTGPTPGFQVADHHYRFVLPAAGRTYDLSNLEITSAPGGSECCKCEVNVKRRLQVNGVPVVADGDGNELVLLRR